MGFGGRGVFWEPQLESLSSKHRLLWFDHRGIGESDAPRGGATTTEMALDVIRLMDQMEWPSAHIVGMSMGGMVAQEVALGHRHRVRSLSLISTTAVGLRGGLSTPQAVPVFFGAFAGPRRTREFAAGRLLFTRRFLEEGGASILEGVFQKKFNPAFTPRGFWAHLCAVIFHNAEARLSQLEGLATLVAWGEDDVLIAASESRSIAKRIPGATTLAFENTGHGLNWQHKEALNTALLAHFERTDSRLMSQKVAG